MMIPPRGIVIWFFRETYPRLAYSPGFHLTVSVPLVASNNALFVQSFALSLA